MTDRQEDIMIHANGQKDRQIGRQTDIFTDRRKKFRKLRRLVGR